MVVINARQQQLDVDDVRLGSLVSQIRARAVDPNDGRAIAPDVLVLNE
ncbi:MAG: hypothetical protein QOH26_1092, partial [Actinomycetota bacterium]|nr:hypothetical protein [Actinomycetota bacterium]